MEELIAPCFGHQLLPLSEPLLPALTYGVPSATASAAVFSTLISIELEGQLLFFCSLGFTLCLFGSSSSWLASTSSQIRSNLLGEAKAKIVSTCSGSGVALVQPLKGCLSASIELSLWAALLVAYLDHVVVCPLFLRSFGFFSIPVVPCLGGWQIVSFGPMHPFTKWPKQRHLVQYLGKHSYSILRS